MGWIPPRESAAWARSMRDSGTSMCQESPDTTPGRRREAAGPRRSRFHRKPGWECCLSSSLGAEELFCTILILPGFCSLDSATQRSLPPAKLWELQGWGEMRPAKGWASESHSPRAFQTPPCSPQTQRFFLVSYKNRDILPLCISPAGCLQFQPSWWDGCTVPSPGNTICWNKVWLPRVLLGHQIYFPHGPWCNRSNSQSLLPVMLHQKDPIPHGFEGCFHPKGINVIHKGLLTLA